METSLDDFGVVLTCPFKPGDRVYDVRKLDAFCKENGILPSSLSDEELSRFIFGEIKGALGA